MGVDYQVAMEAALKNAKPYEKFTVPDLPPPNAIRTWLRKLATSLVIAASYYDNAGIPWVMSCEPASFDELADSSFKGSVSAKHRWAYRTCL